MTGPAPVTPFLLAWEVLHALDRMWWGLVSDRGDGSFEQPPGPHARLSGTHDTVIVSGRVCQLEQKDQNAQLRDNPPYRLRHWRCRSQPHGRSAMSQRDLEEFVNFTLKAALENEPEPAARPVDRLFLFRHTAERIDTLKQRLEADDYWWNEAPDVAVVAAATAGMIERFGSIDAVKLPVTFDPPYRWLGLIIYSADSATGLDHTIRWWHARFPPTMEIVTGVVTGVVTIDLGAGEDTGHGA